MCESLLEHSVRVCEIMYVSEGVWEHFCEGGCVRACLSEVVWEHVCEGGCELRFVGACLCVRM